MRQRIANQDKPVASVLQEPVLKDLPATAMFVCSVTTMLATPDKTTEICRVMVARETHVQKMANALKGSSVCVLIATPLGAAIVTHLERHAKPCVRMMSIVELVESAM
ncbi:MAG: hypothetical protein KC431_19535 [Myxococcales bacterium]|nr:hypothetical protein [Myxococcales bacterium]